MNTENLRDEIARYTETAEKGIGTLAERLEALEVKADRSSLHKPGEKPEQRAYRDAFLQFLREPKSSMRRADLESKAVTIGTSGAGGYAVPELISSEVAKRMRDLSPLRQIARVV